MKHINQQLDFCFVTGRAFFSRAMCMAQDDRAVEFQNAVLLLMMAGWWASPWWDVYTGCARVYLFMDWLPQGVWGAIFFVISAGHLFALWINNRWWRKHLLLIKAALWLNLAITVAFGDYAVPSCGLFLLLSINSFRGFLCLRPARKYQ